ncbi:MAG: hypothetical protein ACE5EX_09350 [Phycisphaerae bacterium]
MSATINMELLTADRRSQAATPGAAPPADLQRLRTVAGQVVGSTFYGTLLKIMRDSSLKGPYGHGGRGEQVFGAQLDGLLAERMGTTTQGGLADGLFRHLERQQRLIGARRTESNATYPELNGA